MVIEILKNFGIRLLQLLFVSAGLFALMGFSGCNFSAGGEEEVSHEVWDSLMVTASAFNSTRAQTGPGNPNISAWGDTIHPGMNIIAVSRDLIKRGLKHNTPVIIEGLDGVFLVKDKMHYRWNNKIDIYMGDDVAKAREWGRKKVKIYYQVLPDSLKIN